MASICFTPSSSSPQFFGFVYDDFDHVQRLIVCSRSSAPHSCACNFFLSEKRRWKYNKKWKTWKKETRQNAIMDMFQWNKKIYLKKIQIAFFLSFLLSFHLCLQFGIPVHTKQTIHWYSQLTREREQRKRVQRGMSWSLLPRALAFPYKEWVLVWGLASFTWSSSWCR